MKRNNLFLSMAVVAIAALVTVNVRMSSSSNNLLTDLTDRNLEALAQSEAGGGSGWDRDDGDCTITVTAKAGATVHVLGVPVTVNADGIGYVTFTNAKTDCYSGGNEQCMARYCDYSALLNMNK